MDWIGMGKRVCPEPLTPFDGKGLSQLFMGKS